MPLPPSLRNDPWAQRIERERATRKPRLVVPAGYVASPAINAAIAAAQACGARDADRQLAIMAEHRISETPALSGRYGRAA